MFRFTVDWYWFLKWYQLMDWSKSIILSLLLIWHIVYPKTVYILNWNSGYHRKSRYLWIQHYKFGVSYMSHITQRFFFSHLSSGKRGGFLILPEHRRLWRRSLYLKVNTVLYSDIYRRVSLTFICVMLLHCFNSTCMQPSWLNVECYQL